MSGPWIAGFVALWIGFLTLAVILLGLLRRMSPILERAEAQLGMHGGKGSFGGAPVASAVAPFQLVDAGGRTALSRESVEEPTLLLFVAPGCGPCEQILGGLDGVGHRYEGVPFHVVVEEGEGEVEAPPGVSLLYERGRSASTAFQTIATPHAFVVDHGGLVLDQRIPGSVDDLRRMALRQRGGGGPTDGHESHTHPHPSEPAEGR
jgi:thiol-disulfide isomerase/thioredoxin